MYAKNFYGGNGIVGAQVPLELELHLHKDIRKMVVSIFNMEMVPLTKDR